MLHVHSHSQHTHIEANFRRQIHGSGVAKTWWKPLRNHVQRYPFAVHQPLNYLHFVRKISKFVHRDVCVCERAAADERFLYIAVQSHTHRIQMMSSAVRIIIIFFFNLFSLLFSPSPFNARCGCLCVHVFVQSSFLCFRMEREYPFFMAAVGEETCSGPFAWGDGRRERIPTMRRRTERE